MAALTVEDILTGAALGVTSGLVDLFVLETGGRCVLYALSRGEACVLELEISANGALSFDDSLQLQGTFAAGSNPSLGLLPGATNHLTLGGLSPSAGQGVSLSGTGELGGQVTLNPFGTLRAPQAVDAGGVPVLVTGGFSGGLLHYADAGSGYALTSSLSDTADRYLADVTASASFSVAGTQYVATVSGSEDGVNLARVTPTGVQQSGALGTTEGLPVNDPSDIAAVSAMGEYYLAVASFGTSSLSILRVDNGEPLLAEHVLDSEATRFAEASRVAAAASGDFAYVAVGGGEGGVSLFTILPGGRLVHLDSVAEDETVPLDQIGALSLDVLGGALQIFAGSELEPGLTRLEYDLSQAGSVVVADGLGSAATGTALDDQIIGSDVGESLSGQAGDDILLDGAGSDTMAGGSGADLFAFTADSSADAISDFQRGVDRLDLSAFDFLYDVSQLTITPNATGAQITFGAEVIDLTTSDLAPLTAAELSNDDILNVDRPPFLLVGREITGGAGSDTLNGGAGDDTIDGQAGDDSLSGQAGDDSLIGGLGLDVLLGNSGNDTLQGDAESDTLSGGAGDDLLFGGDGGDVLYGDEWIA